MALRIPYSDTGGRAGLVHQSLGWVHCSIGVISPVRFALFVTSNRADGVVSVVASVRFPGYCYYVQGSAVVYKPSNRALKRKVSRYGR